MKPNAMQTTLEVLCNRVIAATEGQLVRAVRVLCADMSARQVGRILRRLEAQRFVASREIGVSIVAVGQPLDVYRPEELIERERCERLMAASHELWRDAEPTLHKVYFALPKAWKVMGHTGHKGFIQHSALSHDLSLAEVFVRYVERHPKYMGRWQYEPGADTREKFVKQPDAWIRDDQGPRFVEMIGVGYDAKRIGLLWQHARTCKIPMECY